MTTNWDHKSRMTSSALNCTQLNHNNNNNNNNNNAANNVESNAITRVTPTSSDQRIDVEYELDNERDQSQERMSDNEEEVVVDNTDDEIDCGMKRKQQLLQQQHHQHQMQSQLPSAQRVINGLREMKKR